MKKIISVLALMAIPAMCLAQSFDFDSYYRDITQLGTSDQAAAAFNARYLTNNRGTSVVDKPHWLFPDDVYYGDNSASANLMALASGIVPDDCHEEVLKNLVTDIIRLNGGHYVGDGRTLDHLLPVLSREGRSDVAFLLSKRDSALLGGRVGLWRCETLAGIVPVGNDGVLRIRPDFSVENLEDVDERCGAVRSRWHKDLMSASLDLELPSDAEVWLPVSSKRQVHSHKGSRFLRFEDGCSVWGVKAGNVHFDFDFDMPDHVAGEQFLFESHDWKLCHSPSITETTSGELLAVFSGGDNEAAPNTRIYMTRKAKGGDDWSEPVEMSASSLADTTVYCTYNPVIYQIPGGDLLLFYHTKGNTRGKLCHLRRSSDGGRTWSEAETLPFGITCAERAQPVYIDGLLIAPGDNPRPYVIRPTFCLSEDQGRTWTVTEPASAEYGIAFNNRKPGRVGENFDVPADNIPRERAFEILASIQPAILVHGNGALQALTRTCHSKMGCVWSYDGGRTWGHEYLTDQPSNQTGFSAITLKDGRFVKVFNDFESLPGAPRWEHLNARTPLTLAVSDDGIVWTKVMDLETGPIHNNKFPSGYCYPNVIEGTDGYLHVVYTWQRERIKYVKIKL